MWSFSIDVVDMVYMVDVVDMVDLLDVVHMVYVVDKVDVVGMSQKAAKSILNSEGRHKTHRKGHQPHPKMRPKLAQIRTRFTPDKAPTTEGF